MSAVTIDSTVPGRRRAPRARATTSPPPPSCSAPSPCATGARCTTTTSSPSSRNGTQDIFLNTPNQAAWFERYITDWTGPTGRLGRMKFRMKGSVFPGDTMVFRGTVTGVETDDTGCGWVDVDVALTVGDRCCTTCAVRIALPTTPDDNPWTRRGERWKP